MGSPAEGEPFDGACSVSVAPSGYSVTILSGAVAGGVVGVGRNAAEDDAVAEISAGVEQEDPLADGWRAPGARGAGAVFDPGSQSVVSPPVCARTRGGAVCCSHR